MNFVLCAGGYVFGARNLQVGFTQCSRYLLFWGKSLDDLGIDNGEKVELFHEYIVIVRSNNNSVTCHKILSFSNKILTYDFTKSFCHLKKKILRCNLGIKVERFHFYIILMFYA